MAFVPRFTTITKLTQYRRSVSTSRTYVTNFVDDLFDGLIKSKRSDLAKSITLVETTNAEKKKQSQKLLHKVLDDLKRKRSNNNKPSLRIGFLNYYFNIEYNFIY